MASDSEEDVSPAEEEDEEVDDEPKKKSKKSRLSDDEEEDEDEGSDLDEDDDDEEDDGPKRKKRRKKSGAGFDISKFLDVEADVDDDDDDDDNESELGDFIDRGEERGEAREAAEAAQNLHNYRRHTNDLFNKSEDELANEFLARHQRYAAESDAEEAASTRGVGGAAAGGRAGAAAIEQQALLPSVRDPKMWAIRCKPGQERATVIALMHKFFDRQQRGQPLLIKSAIAPTHIKGFVYVEADKEHHVKQAVFGVRTLSGWTASLVPIKEMPDVLAVARPVGALRRNQWVRIARGVHRGDLAQVFEVDEARSRVTVKLIPRLDLNKSSLGAGPEDKKRGKQQRRPAPKFFNAPEVEAIMGREAVDRKQDPRTREYYYVYGGQRFKDGYLLKNMNIKSILSNNVEPTLEELEKFQQQQPGGEDGAAAGEQQLPPVQQRKVVLQKGDLVKVVEGDLKNLTGVVESINQDPLNPTVVIMPKHDELHELLTFPLHEVRKFFKSGNHVKVIGGKFQGETGLVVRADDTTVTIFSDVSQTEIALLAADVQEASDTSSSNVRLGQYELLDLVHLTPQTVGVIVSVNRTGFRVLDQHGSVQNVSLQEIGAKRMVRNVSAFDAHQNTIHVGDVVRVQDGIHKGRQGTVHALFRYFAFLHSRDTTENAGIYVAKTNNTVLLGGSKGPQNRGDAFSTPRSLPPQSPASRPRGGGAPRGGFGPSHGGGGGRGQRDPFVSKAVIIKAGQWKGYHGIVKEATPTTVRVELHTKCKTVTISRDHIHIKGDEAPSGTATPTATPMWSTDPSRTPMHAYADPTRTPMRDADPTRTPMREWDPTRTPLRDGWDPSRTPMRGEAGDQTPLRTPGTPLRSYQSAWDPSVTNTPMRAPNTPSGSMMHTGGGSAWDPSFMPDNNTPGSGGGYGSYFSASTPSGGFTPHTPSTAPLRTPQPRTPATAPGPEPSPGGGYTPHTPGTAGLEPQQHGASLHPGGYTPLSSTSTTPQQPEPTPPSSVGSSGLYSPFMPAAPGSAPDTPSGAGLRSSGFDWNMDVAATPSTAAASGLGGGAGLGGAGAAGVGGGDYSWQLADIEVSYDGAHWVVLEPPASGAPDPTTTLLRLGADAVDIVRATARDIGLVEPSKGHAVRVIRGEYKGLTGTLMGVDVNDGIVKMDDTRDIKILDRHNLGKFVKR